jgi:hypothetical protein
MTGGQQNGSHFPRQLERANGSQDKENNETEID